MVNIILSGANGKMGQVITRLAAESDDVEIVSGVDINDSIKNSYPVYKSVFEVTQSADVIIDFSHPMCLEPLLDYACEKKIPAVIATTGLSDNQKKLIKKASEHTAVFFSANMSLGINLITDLAKRAAKLLEDDFDIEIVERHHRQKIDAPSGTALAIADEISDVLSQTPVYIYDRHSQRKKRGKAEIGLHSVRGGTIVGDHEIIFAGTDEVIEISHHAASKEVFAVGAIRAAKFLYEKKNKNANGLYNMNDLISSL